MKAKDESTGEAINADALIEQKYEEYRKDFLVRQVCACVRSPRFIANPDSPQNWALYLEHRDVTWFIEKYGTDEAMQQLRIHATRQGRVPAAQKYVEELEKGMWDEVNYDASGTSLSSARAYPFLTQFRSQFGRGEKNEGRQGSQWHRIHGFAARGQSRRGPSAAQSDFHQVDPPYYRTSCA